MSNVSTARGPPIRPSASMAATATLSRWNFAQEFLRAGFSADRIAERQINAARKRSPAESLSALRSAICSARPRSQRLLARLCTDADCCQGQPREVALTWPHFGGSRSPGGDLSGWAGVSFVVPRSLGRVSPKAVRCDATRGVRDGPPPVDDRVGVGGRMVIRVATCRVPAAESVSGGPARGCSVIDGWLTPRDAPARRPPRGVGVKRRHQASPGGSVRVRPGLGLPAVPAAISPASWSTKTPEGVGAGCGDPMPSASVNRSCTPGWGVGQDQPCRQARPTGRPGGGLGDSPRPDAAVGGDGRAPPVPVEGVAASQRGHRPGGRPKTRPGARHASATHGLPWRSRCAPAPAVHRDCRGWGGRPAAARPRPA
jgi:hypothetical protein